MVSCMRPVAYICTLANKIDVTNDADHAREQIREFDRCFANFIKIIEHTENITEIQPNKEYNKFIRLKLVELHKIYLHMPPMRLIEVAMDAYLEI